MNLWQLRKLSTNENLSEPQVLPENWGPIFGLPGIKDKIGDLSWLGDPQLVGCGWVETDIPVPKPATVSKEESTINTIRNLLTQSDWSMLPDVPMTVGKKSEWIEYRRLLREVKYQSNFPDDIKWPSKPE